MDREVRARHSVTKAKCLAALVKQFISLFVPSLVCSYCTRLKWYAMPSSVTFSKNKLLLVVYSVCSLDTFL